MIAIRFIQARPKPGQANQPPPPHPPPEKNPEKNATTIRPSSGLPRRSRLGSGGDGSFLALGLLSRRWRVGVGWIADGERSKRLSEVGDW